MKKLLVILLFFFLPGALSAQQWIENRDSVIEIIKTLKDDTLKVYRLGNLAILYTFNTPDSAVKYANLMLELAERLNYKKGIGQAYGNLSSAHNVLGNYSQAISYAFESAKVFRRMGDTLAAKALELSVGEIYYEMGDYRRALEYEYAWRRFLRSKSDSFWEKYFEQSMKQTMMYSDVGLAASYNLGNILDSALFFARRAFAADRELNLYWSKTPLELGNVYLKLNEFDSALKYYKSVVKIPAQNNQIDVNVGMATAFYKLKKNDSCIYYAQMALDTARAIRYNRGIMNASEVLSIVYENTDPAKAIEYYKIRIATRDSLYNRDKISQVNNLMFNEEKRKQELKEAEKNYNNRLKMYGLLALVGIFLTIVILLYRNNLHRKKAYVLVTKQKNETDNQKKKVESALEELRTTQKQLIHSEKMASLGELTAGIAHEIQNPLNFVNNFSDVNQELLDELKTELATGNLQQATEIADDIKENEQKINHHGKRADAIVKGMLQHSRVRTGQKEPTDINALSDEYLRLSYHGMRAKDKSFNATLKTDFDESIGNINVIPQDIGRVLLNLYNNAFYAVMEKMKSSPDDYQPIVSVNTKKINDKIEIRVKDNGNGIPQNIIDKIFQPFFTTKPTGQGTGLGLSLTYDIVKAHGGEIKVETKEGEGAEFIIQLPQL